MVFSTGRVRGKIDKQALSDSLSPVRNITKVQNGMRQIRGDRIE